MFLPYQSRVAASIALALDSMARNNSASLGGRINKARDTGTDRSLLVFTLPHTDTQNHTLLNPYGFLTIKRRLSRGGGRVASALDSWTHSQTHCCPHATSSTQTFAHMCLATHHTDTDTDADIQMQTQTQTYRYRHRHTDGWAQCKSCPFPHKLYFYVYLSKVVIFGLGDVLFASLSVPCHIVGGDVRKRREKKKRRIERERRRRTAMAS